MGKPYTYSICMAFLHAKPSDVLSVLCYVIPSAIYPSVGEQSCLSPVESTLGDCPISQCKHSPLWFLSLDSLSNLGQSLLSYMVKTSLCFLVLSIHLVCVITLCPYCFEFYKQFPWGIINASWTLHVQRHLHVFACKTNNLFCFLEYISMIIVCMDTFVILPLLWL